MTWDRVLPDPPSAEEFWRRLGEALGGREPVIVECAALTPGVMLWTPQHLPNVMCAPDVFAAYSLLPSALLGELYGAPMRPDFRVQYQGSWNVPRRYSDAELAHDWGDDDELEARR